jgi:hypothetical protein
VIGEDGVERVDALGVVGDVAVGVDRRAVESS